MGFLDPAKLLVILVLGLIVLGPERLPVVLRKAGGYWRAVTLLRERAEGGVRYFTASLDIPSPAHPPAAALTNFLGELMGQPIEGGIGASGSRGYQASNAAASSGELYSTSSESVAYLEDRLHGLFTVPNGVAGSHLIDESTPDPTMK